MIYCPVAGCGKAIRGNDGGYKHFQNYDEFHKRLHYNWLKFFFPDIAKSSEPDVVKFRKAYREWQIRERDLHKQHKKSSTGDGSVIAKDGKFYSGGSEITKEEAEKLYGIKTSDMKP